MEPYTKTLADYLDIVRRRKAHIGVTWLLVTLITVIVAYNLPKIYRSTATLLIETPIPPKYIDAPVSQYGEEQIQSIYQRVLSTDKVLAIIEQNDLYDEFWDSMTPFELAEMFKSSTNVELTTLSIAPQAHSQMAEIAFAISFSHAEPVIAQEIASKLAALFIEQNDRARTQRASKATDFLTEEVEKLNRELQEVDIKIAKYKEEHNFSLPEQMEGNQAAIDRAEGELRDTEAQIRTTKDRLIFLNAELARTQDDDPMASENAVPKTKAEALRMLRAKYLRYSSIYSPNHPSLLRLKREIRALDPSFEGEALEQGIRSQLDQAKAELKTLKETYGDGHPDVAARRKQVTMLESRLKSLRANARNSVVGMGSSSGSPYFRSVEAQYKASQNDLDALVQKQSYLKTKIENLHEILLKAPQIEMVYTDMLRTRDNIIKKYNQLKEKRLDAKLAQTLEEQQQGQTLTMIEPPVIPNHPEKAIRRKVAIGGFCFGLIAGLGVAFLIELLAPGVRGYRAVREITGLMPLVVLPYIESPAELTVQFARQCRIRKFMVRTAFGFGAVALVVAGLAFFGLR
ncbi:GumC family protein [Methylomicrobium album]|uniref:Uncharacterized protein involved in exopolysaccharide biosynthesis n=1 Tax=Methylomicrobium album BG8 TaxID=686340 RepID=H8GLY7_METAL|nr:LPS biosynthesis protein [Methylomicrobium album]EIC28183.1 uncharacterized protein involved in exopolysaccharide biosynthesis [Methylomicrobium album BG8]